MSSEPSSPGFIDPNARLLASVIPPPPPTLRARLVRFITTRRSGDLRGVVRWSRSREGRACFLAALAGVALTLGFYRSESSSAASAGPAPAARHELEKAASGASVRSEPLALTPASASAKPVAEVNARAQPASDAIANDTDVADDTAVPDDAAADDDAAEDDATPPTVADASDRKAAVRSAPRKAASARSKGRKAKQSRKAKRQAVARASSRSKRAKSQRATAAGPLAAWLATQRSKEASASKRR